MPQYSAKLVAMWLFLFVEWSSGYNSPSSPSSNLDIDCRRDYVLTQLTNPNNRHCLCNGASPGCKVKDNFCYNDCFKESSTVCYQDALVNEAMTEGAKYYDELKSFESNLLAQGIVAKKQSCSNRTVLHPPVPSEIQADFDASRTLEISVSFLGKSIEAQANTENDNRAFRHFAYRPTSRCGYDTSAVCTDNVPADCDQFQTIRSYDGVCNNLKNKKMGASMTPYFSLIPPQFDSMTSNFGSHNARRTSLLLSSTQETQFTSNAELPNILFVFGSQAFVHEIGSLQDFRFPEGGHAPRCCGLNGEQKLPENLKLSHCMPINILPGDPFFDSSKNCIEFVRAQRTHDSCQFARQRFVNTATTPIDASIIYGSSEADNLATRDENSKFARDAAGRRKFGDDRNSQTASLFMFHDLFGNLHDMVMDELQDYEATRKFVIGTMQKIFIDLIAVAVGKTWTETYDLYNHTDCYDPNIPLVTLTEFSQSVGRYSHEFVPSNVKFHYKNGAPVVRNLKEMFGLRTIPTDEDKNALLWGMAKQKLQEDDVSFVLQNELIIGGCDLFSIDHQREKDAEVEAYIKYLKYYRAACIKDFDDLVSKKIMLREDVELLRRAFKDVNNVPLSMGARLECSGEESVLPATVAQITLDQVNRLRCGDRYYWTRKDINSQKTIAAIKKMTIRELVCCYAKGYITELPENSFMTEGPNNPKKPCVCRNVADMLNL